MVRPHDVHEPLCDAVLALLATLPWCDLEPHELCQTFMALTATMLYVWFREPTHHCPETWDVFVDRCVTQFRQDLCYMRQQSAHEG